MEINPLAKIPCLFLVTAYQHLAYTSPNPPASAENRPAAPSLADRILKGMMILHTPDYTKACLWGSVLAESAVILATAYPSHAISKSILQRLLFGGDGRQIRLTGAAALGIPLGIAAGALRAWCYREMGKYFTFEMSMVKDQSLVTTGPYSVVRHPSYAGTVLTGISVFLIHGTRGSWVRESGLLRYFPGKMGAATLVIVLGLAASALLGRMKAEDRELRTRFGDKWDAWAAKVRYMVIPGVL